MKSSNLFGLQELILSYVGLNPKGLFFKVYQTHQIFHLV